MQSFAGDPNSLFIITTNSDLQPTIALSASKIHLKEC